MKGRRRFCTGVEAASIEEMQIKALIDSLSRRVELLECDIDNEEERTSCRDRCEPCYSVMARNLVARRDNLIATIAALEERLSKTALPTSIHHATPKALLPPA